MMRIPPVRSDAFQRGLTRAGTAVWLLAGVVLLAAAVLRTPWAGAADTSATRTALAAEPAPTPTDSADVKYQPEPSLESGDEVVMVFVGASFCNAQKIAGFPDVVEAAKMALRDRARARGQRFRAVGVALDWSPAEGLAFLGRFGEFDEVASGGNWIGDAATRYVWRDIPGSADVPQVIVLQRTVDAAAAIRITGDRELKRIVGARAIQDWVEDGAAL